MPKTGATLDRVLRTAASRSDSPATDSELLRRFADDGDQDAFAALVRRHTGLVLSACQRVLANTQDAEDACQATFLILARKAASGGWRPSIANWLFTTARRVAGHQRRAAERRKRREGKVPAAEAVVPVDRMTARELLAIIDQELDRLPSIYREVLLLYYQAELSRDEIATRLGIPAATVKIRLERGRKRLGNALTNRGVTLSIGLLALLATSRAGASPPRLVDAIRATAAGKVPPNVAALAEGVAVNGLLKKAFLGAVVLCAAVAIGFGVGVPQSTTAGQPPEKSMPAKGKDKKDAPPATPVAQNSIAVAGKVVDPDGKPVAGAKFAIIDDEIGAPVPKVATGADGRFAFEMAYPKGVRNPRQVVASAPGFGLEWLSEPREDSVFKLVPDQPITGRVIDLQGKPVAGATVAVHNIHAGALGAFDALLKTWKASAEERDAAAGKLDRSIWNRGGLGLAFQVKTGADGKFTLSGLGADRVVTLLVSGTAIADTFADVVTRKGFDPAGVAPAPKRKRGDVRANPLQLHAPDLSVVVGPDKPVTGVVRDAETGAPLPGVRVAGAAVAGELGFGPLWFHTWPTPATTTDKEGRFTLRGLAKARAYVLVADPEEGSPYLHRFHQVADTVAFDPITSGFSLPRGVVLTGRVTDATTGAGVASRVFYRPLLTNDQLFDGYDPPDYPAPWHHGRDTKTDMEGRYTITVAAGAGVVNFQAYGGNYERARATQKEIDDGIVDKRFGHFRTRGQGGMYNPEFMHAYKVTDFGAKERTATLDVKYKPTEPPKK
ncbi:MAG TPA: sigma-70 family RNA polymerase sigma factor [Gemmataceae bacterium]|nr:sigma-70 family RNA polymerase sigma factor [Gemmataceae bacterium]